MKALLLLLVGCTPTFTDHFIETTPVRALANRSPMHGTSCKSLCSSKHPFDGIDYCAVATFDLNSRLVCTVDDHLNWLVDAPANVELPATGDLPIELCATGCTKHLDNGKKTITKCAGYPYRPDETEPYLVCSFHKSRKAQTM